MTRRGFPGQMFWQWPGEAGGEMAAFRATVGDEVIARSDAVVLLEGNVYFPPDAVDQRYLTSSRAKSLCPWKGIASYYTLEADGLVLPNAAWCYRHPSPLARRIKDHVAFFPIVRVEECR